MDSVPLAIGLVGCACLLLGTLPGAQTPRTIAPATATLTSESVVGHALSPDGTWLAFVSDRTLAGTFELWGAPVDQSLAAVQLSGGGLPGGNVLASPSIEISATLRVVYVARQAQDELYSVPVDGSAPPVKLNGPLVSGGRVRVFELDLQGARVIYRADQEVLGREELYSVPIDGSAAPVKLSSGEPTVADRISPDGSRVVFATGSGVPRNLYSRPIDAGAPASVLGVAILSSSSLSPEDQWRPRFTPDGSYLVYQEAVNGSEVRLKSVAVDGSSFPVELHGLRPTGSSSALTPAGDVVSWAPGASSTRPTPLGRLSSA